MKTDAPAPAAPEAAVHNGPLAWAGVVLICLIAVLAAGFEALLVPLYSGSHLFPITVVLTLLSNIALPLMARTLVRSLLALVLPFISWLVMMIGFGIVPRPEGDVILPGGPPQWVSYAVILGGALAGVITVVIASPQATLPPRPPTAATRTDRAPVKSAPIKSAPVKRAPAPKRKG
jgi:hypothetical protein